MSKAKVKKTTLLEQAKTYSHNIFLANLGIYGKAYEESKALAKKTASKYKDMNNKRDEMFEELIVRGEKIQHSVIETVKKSKNEQISSLEDRVKSLRESFVKAKTSVMPVKKDEAEKAA